MSGTNLPTGSQQSRPAWLRSTRTFIARLALRSGLRWARLSERIAGWIAPWTKCDGDE